MIRASAHYPYKAGRPDTGAKLVAAILALAVLCVLSGIGGAWVAHNVRITGSTSQPSPMPAETVEPEPMGTVVPL